jgi:predicted dithiol-disulfide oxidoreductase (DUF899 family)
MPERKIGAREEWQAARNSLAELEAEQAERDEDIKRKRRGLPWVPVEKEYAFDTEDGKKQLAELFDGRSQLLAYNIMYGPDFEIGACPGCTNLADGFEGLLLHMNKRDVTLICFSRAPIDRLVAYKQRMGWQFPYVSTYGSDFPFDFGLALTAEQARQIPELQQMAQNPPAWLRFWASQVGAQLNDGLRENPGTTAFARENATVYHTYTVTAPDPFVAPYFSFLLDRTPKPQPAEPLNYRRTSTRTEISRSRRNAMFAPRPGDCAESQVPLAPGGAYRGTVISYQWRGLSPAPRWRPCTPTASVAFPATMTRRPRWSGTALAGSAPAAGRSWRGLSTSPGTEASTPSSSTPWSPGRCNARASAPGEDDRGTACPGLQQPARAPQSWLQRCAACWSCRLR